MQLLAVPIPLIGGIGILRRRVWSAYGLALCHCSAILGLGVVLLRDGFADGLSGEQLIDLVLAVGSGVLYFFAGRSLAASGAPRGYTVPWVAVAITAFLPVLFFQVFVIPTGAMENTLLVGDRIVVRRWPGTTPHRGDIVAYRDLLDPKRAFIKRVVAIPGDRVRVVQKRLLINGQEVQEPYAIHNTNYIDSYRDNFPGVPNAPVDPAAEEMLHRDVRNGEIVVPQGDYFVLGDNRDASYDSRYTGFVRANDVLGKPVMLYWSVEAPPAGSGTAGPVRWNRVFKLL